LLGRKFGQANAIGRGARLMQLWSYRAQRFHASHVGELQLLFLTVVRLAAFPLR
jgi:hypothetical protein